MFKHVFALSLVILFAIAQVGYCASNNWGNTDTNQLLGRVLPSYLITVGSDVSGSSTTVASGTSIIPISGYSLVSKTIGEGSGTVCTVADGEPGQILKIMAGTVTASCTAVITPATKTGFSTVTLTTAKQAVTLHYVNDVMGWEVIGTVNNPTVS
jgi:hypothetical protein